MCALVSRRTDGRVFGPTTTTNYCPVIYELRFWRRERERERKRWSSWNVFLEFFFVRRTAFDEKTPQVSWTTSRCTSRFSPVLQESGNSSSRSLFSSFSLLWTCVCSALGPWFFFLFLYPRKTPMLSEDHEEAGPVVIIEMATWPVPIVAVGMREGRRMAGSENS